LKLTELARDPELVPANSNREEKAAHAAFIVSQVKRFRGTVADPINIPDGDVPALRSRLRSEIALADSTYKAILNRIKADTASDKLLRLTGVDKRIARRYRKSRITPSNLMIMRLRLVRFIVWRALSGDNSLLTAPRFEALHLLVDRRLRMAERMLYDIGRVEGWERGWRVKEIRRQPANPWEDGWNRMFEYPRLPQKLKRSGDGKEVFLGICKPHPQFRRCQEPSMTEWYQRGVEHIMLVGHTRLNPKATPLWQRPPDGDDYAFYLKHAPPPNADPAAAIEQLFTPSTDYKKRNLLFCDHVIHVLHLEALLAAKKKRDPSTRWLTDLSNSNSAGWIRIDFGFKGGNTFLASMRDTTFFETKRIQTADLQIGDHLIVYNHPAYDKATVGGVWRLENAVVVQLYPRLLLQGHGTNPLTLDEMKRQMVRLFNKELDRLRQRILDHIASRGTATTIDFSGRGELVQRWPAAMSLYTPANTRADWWLRWKHDAEKDEPDIAKSETRKKLALKTHGVEYDDTYGYFPLWKPQVDRRKQPVRDAAGRTKRIEKVRVTPDMVAAWTWMLPEKQADRGKALVIRPKA
jgi:hypothetical protein